MEPANSSLAQTRYDAILSEARRRRQAFADAQVPKIHIGMATCGIASGALETKEAFEEALAQRGIEALIHTVGCVGHCYAEPVVVIDHPDSGFPPSSFTNSAAITEGFSPDPARATPKQSRIHFLELSTVCFGR